MEEILKILQEKNQEEQLILQLIFVEKQTCLDVAMLLNKEYSSVQKVYESFLEELRIKGICKIRKLNLAC